MAPSLKKTPLHPVHVSLGARLMPFGGFEMPVQYSGIIDEHMAVREAAGLFDVSHMGEIAVRGMAATAYLQHLVTNDVTRLYDGRAMYTVMCDEKGGIIDDLLVYRRSENDYFLVVNAANVESDFDWMQSHRPAGAELENISDTIGLVALQGPEAFGIARQLTDYPLDEIRSYHFKEFGSGDFGGLRWALVAHTGYTGERGLEIYSHADEIRALWARLMESGTSAGLKPAGLGARDTLRLEAGFPLYGNDITRDTNPLEAGLGWLTRLEKGPFIGSDALRETGKRKLTRKLVSFVMEERGIPRSSCKILARDGDEEIGFVTSGSQSPVRGAGIGMGYVTNRPEITAPGSRLLINIRNRNIPATVAKPPLHKN